ncbi:hypothetical protein NOVO_07430 [Rickettsiales bacterium Ac37b]|nr:hypothetical protein NOVO_07430 [Rickettsiales bacterium Ac37b]
MKNFQKFLRKNTTSEERILWYYLRDRRFYDFKFRRQHIIKNYIVDFICLSHKIVIELDGGHHSYQQNYDNKRDSLIKAEGFKILRFWNNEIKDNVEGVLETLHLTLLSIPPHPRKAKLSSTSPKGEVK